MNRIKQIRRMAGVLAGLACAWIGAAAVAPSAFATFAPPDQGAGFVSTKPAPAATQTLVVGGMPGWQITLIAVGAALVAAAIAVLLDRARAARRTAITAVG